MTRRYAAQLLALMIFGAAQVIAQVSPEEHAAHHPVPAPPVASAGGQAGGESEMMDDMLAAPPREFYPTLMALPALTPERKRAVEEAAHERMQSGTELMADGIGRLARTVANSDYAEMQDAVALVREGAARFDSGLAAHQAIAGGESTQSIALRWFRTNMGLPPMELDEAVATDAGGVSWFHVWVMLSSISFAVVAIAAYVMHLRRASRLLNSLLGEPSKSSSAPASQPAAPSQSVPPSPATPSSASVASLKWSGALRVGRIFDETPNVKTFRCVSPVGGVIPFDYLPGQFITVAVPAGESRVRRSYTISSSPTQRDFVEITVKHDSGGLVSGYLHERLAVGDLLEVAGPSGTFVFTGRECKCILLIAGGVGITPLMSVVRYLLDRSWSGDIYLIYGCRSPADIIFREELLYLARRHRNFRVAMTVTHPEGTDWNGNVGRIDKELISTSVPDLPSRYVHVCGPAAMMDDTQRALTLLGVPSSRIKREAFGPALGRDEPEIVRRVAAVPPVASASPSIPTVTFTESEKTAPIPPHQVVLEVAESIGVDIDYSCRSGTCGVCRVKLQSGSVEMAIEDGLQPGDRENGMILACQAKAREDISVQA